MDPIGGGLYLILGIAMIGCFFVAVGALCGIRNSCRSIEKHLSRIAEANVRQAASATRMADQSEPPAPPPPIRR